MPQLIEAHIDENGRVHLTEIVRLAGRRRALVIVLEDDIQATIETDPRLTETEVAFAGPRYRIDNLLSQGGMGQAFVGTDCKTGQRVCIKKLRSGVGSEVIAHEWQTLMRVDSPYVVRFLDRFQVDGELHLVMEYIDGPLLADKIQAGVPARELAWLGYTLFCGVQAFHELEIIHCDLKPGNVLIQMSTLIHENEPGWIPRIIDFGLAILDRRDADGALTGIGRIAGTPAYMAPEQVRGWMLSPACDVYAVGLMLYESLARSPAFRGDRFSLMAAKTEQQAGLQLEQVPDGVPAEFANLVEQCTHPNPNYRPSAADAARRLEAWLSSPPVSHGDSLKREWIDREPMT